MSKNFEAVNAELREISEENVAAYFDVTEDIDILLKSEWVHDIYAMHTKFGVREIVQTFDRQKLLSFIEFRLKFLQEELDEAFKAYEELKALAGSGNVEAVTEAADDLVDSMIDLCVVSIGTLDAVQSDADEAWARVNDANMKKEPGIKPERPNPLGLPDLIKPAGWQAPSHADNIGDLAKLA